MCWFPIAGSNPAALAGNCQIGAFFTRFK